MVGLSLDREEGFCDGDGVGLFDGRIDGSGVGEFVGRMVGLSVGSFVGNSVDRREGLRVCG